MAKTLDPKLVEEIKHTLAEVMMCDIDEIKWYTRLAVDSGRSAQEIQAAHSKKFGKTILITEDTSFRDVVNELA